MGGLRISVGQIATSLDLMANLDKMAKMAEDASRAGSALIVFPEASMAAGTDLAEVITVAEPIDGDFVSALRGIAARNTIQLVAGVWEIESGQIYNTCVAIDSDGEVGASYRKVHLYDAFGFRESDHITPSDNYNGVTFEAAETTAGLNVCYDLRFPESARKAVDAGARMLLLSAAWLPGPEKVEHWLVLARARAIENTCFVVAANQARPLCTGHSVIVGPSGEVLAELGESEELVTADLDLARIDSLRALNPSLANRRFRVVPDLRDN
ncbi:carbon-nitrogen hydrolase family protein [Streptomyces sp. NPDC093252]|uniref:carbon-nitrogen hydrolase family protein n=1 Tax=Streptomyces sp. NPDC093252 TaxID=3154980 RepID=UPI0034251E3A